jgi:hypothetical protein
MSDKTTPPNKRDQAIEKVLDYSARVDANISEHDTGWFYQWSAACEKLRNIEHERSKAELNAPRLLEACKAAQRSIITANEMLFDRIKWEFEDRLHEEAKNLMDSIHMGRTCSLDEFILDVEMAENEKVKCQGLLDSFDAIDDDINSLPEMMELSSQIVSLEDAILNRD